jgi:DNA-binding GntR family transcriptional regulator
VPGAAEVRLQLRHIDTGEGYFVNAPRRRLAPVARESTVDLIAARLRQAIMDGTLPPGSPLGEAELSEQLGVSRGPLREAAQRLVQERLLTTTRRRGLAVVVMDAAEVADVYLARAAVEGAACRQILRTDPKGAVKALVKAHQRLVRATAKQDARAIGDADLDFHRTLVDAAGSPRLSRMAATLLIETRLCTFSLDDTIRVRADMPDSHAQVIDAIRAGDEAALLALVGRHMADATERLTRPLPVRTIDGPAPSAARPLAPLESQGW